MDAHRENGKHSVTDSSGNVFADLGLPHSKEDMLKVQIAKLISDTIERRNLTQVQAAERMKADQSKVSAIVRGRLKEFSTERLLNFLVELGHDVDIHVHRRAKKDPGRIRVTA